MLSEDFARGKKSVRAELEWLVNNCGPVSYQCLRFGRYNHDPYIPYDQAHHNEPKLVSAKQLVGSWKRRADGKRPNNRPKSWIPRWEVVSRVHADENTRTAYVIPLRSGRSGAPAEKRDTHQHEDQLNALYFAYRNSPLHTIDQWQAERPFTIRPKFGKTTTLFADRFALLETQSGLYHCWFENERTSVTKAMKGRYKKLRDYKDAFDQGVIRSSAKVFFLVPSEFYKDAYYKMARKIGLPPNVMFGIRDEVLADPGNVDFIRIRAA